MLYAVVARVKDGRIMVACGNVVRTRNTLLVQTDSGDDNVGCRYDNWISKRGCLCHPEPDEHLKARKNL